MELQEVKNKVIEASSANIQMLQEISAQSEIDNKIPKIVHFCYLDYENIDETHLNYIKSWFETLDNTWTFVNWTPSISQPVCPFENYVLDNNKFAFYADYIRCAKVHDYGGVYFDCDVLLYKDMTPYLEYNYIFDTEFEKPYMDCGAFLAKKGNKYLKIIKESYESESYESYENDTHAFLAPVYWRTALSKKGISVVVNHNNNMTDYKQRTDMENERILPLMNGTILSCPCRTSMWSYILQEPTEETICSHRFEGTWTY